MGINDHESPQWSEHQKGLMEPLEIEVKFYLTNIDSIRNLILDLGATYLSRNFETNIRFEDQHHSLIQNQCLLRLRKDDRATLTFKSRHGNADEEFKISKELEVEVSDFATMSQILESLGFHQEQVYEKWRETYRLSDSLICIDTMPYGDFLEIEGPKNDIKDLSRALGFKWENRILLNYLGIFERLKEKLSLTFSDLTFSNFCGTRINVSDLLPWLGKV